MESREAQLKREARERLFPSLTNPSWLVLTRRREILRGWLSRLPPGKMRVLDVGGRIQPYRALLAGRIACYMALDLRSTPFVNVIARGEQIPLAADQFDLVVCTQMLQYAAEPDRVVAEIHRVLRPGGHLFLSAPAVYPRDAESDRWRFTPQNLGELVRRFQRSEIAPEGSSISGFVRTICVCPTFFVPTDALRAILRFTLVPVLNVTAYSLESAFPGRNDSFAANFSVWAEK